MSSALQPSDERDKYHLHFTDDETEAQSGSKQALAQADIELSSDSQSFALMATPSIN